MKSLKLLLILGLFLLSGNLTAQSVTLHDFSSGSPSTSLACSNSSSVTIGVSFTGTTPYDGMIISLESINTLTSFTDGLVYHGTLDKSTGMYSYSISILISVNVEGTYHARVASKSYPGTYYSYSYDMAKVRFEGYHEEIVLEDLYSSPAQSIGTGYAGDRVFHSLGSKIAVEEKDALGEWHNVYLSQSNDFTDGRLFVSRGGTHCYYTTGNYLGTTWRDPNGLYGHGIFNTYPQDVTPNNLAVNNSGTHIYYQSNNGDNLCLIWYDLSTNQWTRYKMDATFWGTTPYPVRGDICTDQDGTNCFYKTDNDCICRVYWDGAWHQQLITGADCAGSLSVNYNSTYVFYINTSNQLTSIYRASVFTNSFSKDVLTSDADVAGWVNAPLTGNSNVYCLLNNQKIGKYYYTPGGWVRDVVGNGNFTDAGAGHINSSLSVSCINDNVFFANYQLSNSIFPYRFIRSWYLTCGSNTFISGNSKGDSLMRLAVKQSDQIDHSAISGINNKHFGAGSLSYAINADMLTLTNVPAGDLVAKISDMQGRILREERNTGSISIAALPKGFYVITVATGKSFYSSTFYKWQ